MADIFKGSAPDTQYKLNPFFKNRVKYVYGLALKDLECQAQQHTFNNIIL